MSKKIELTIRDEDPYALMYRDASVLHGEKIGTFTRPGDALIARDQLAADEPEWLPPGRHWVVNLDTACVVEWSDDPERVDRDDAR